MEGTNQLGNGEVIGTQRGGGTVRRGWNVPGAWNADRFSILIERDG